MTLESSKILTVKSGNVRALLEKNRNRTVRINGAVDKDCAIRLEDKMARYVIRSSHIKPSKVKGEFPDIIYQYIASDSMINWHFTFTNDIKNAYYFEEFEKDEAKEIAHLWNMRVKEVTA